MYAYRDRIGVWNSDSFFSRFRHLDQLTSDFGVAKGYISDELHIKKR